MLVTTKTIGDLDFLTWLPGDGHTNLKDSVLRGYAEISEHLDDQGALIIQERIFGVLDAAGEILDARSSALTGERSGGVPPTFIEGAPFGDGRLAGIHVIAARPSVGSAPSTVTWRDRPCGCRVDGAEARYLGLSDVAHLLAPSQRSPGAETRETLELTGELLEAQAWSFSDVRRTWFYLDDILSWYDEFNGARNQVFTAMGLLNGSRTSVIPASTGIRGRNLHGHRCTLDLLAIRPHDNEQLKVEMLHNPLQNEAPDYGSAFSRGISVATENCRIFFVSGTASIDEAGATVHTGDFECQTRRTLDNIESLLASRGAVMDDICQATAFVKRQEDIHRFSSILAARNLENLPLVCTIDDICRDDLLVEIDATAVIPLRSSDNG